MKESYIDTMWFLIDSSHYFKLITHAIAMQLKILIY